MEMPDFSGDDLGNDPDVRKERQKTKAYFDMLDSCFSVLKEQLQMRESSHKYFRNFAMFKDLKAGVLQSFSSEFFNCRLIVSLVEYHSSFATARDANAGKAHYLFGWLELKDNYPKTLICKETVKEKITDLLLKMETDFRDHRKFSRRFFVLTEDKKLLTDLLSLKDLEPLTAFPQMELEIHGHACLFRHSRKAVSLKETGRFVELAKAIASVFN